MYSLNVSERQEGGIRKQKDQRMKRKMTLEGTRV